MKNQSNKYWENRANTRMASYHKNSDKAINIITNAYDKAIADINEEVRKIHDKFALEGDLTPGEARQLLNSKISKDELEDLKLKINHIQDEDLKKYLMSRLNSPAYKARMTRLEALKENIYIECKKAYEVELEVSKAAYIDTINNAYYKSIFDIQKGLEVGFSFAQIPTKTIEAILNDPWSGKHFSKRIWNNTDVLADHLNKIVTSGFMSGKGTKKMSLELAEATNVSKFAAERLIRTETTYMANVAEMESYKECDIEKYRFLATLDLRTSDVCREHDSKIYEVDKGVPGENLPPLHPHCRSTTVAHFEDEDSTWLDKRRARNPETGKTYTVWADTNYEKWYKKYVSSKEDIPKYEEKVQNWIDEYEKVKK